MHPNEVGYRHGRDVFDADGGLEVRQAVRDLGLVVELGADQVNERLLDFMEGAFDEVVRYAELHKVNNRIAAYMLAIDRVATALKLRGIYA